MARFTKTNRELCKFSLVMAFALVVVGGLLFWREKELWPWFFGAAGFFLVTGLALPRVLAPVEWAWMKLAHYMGQIMTRLLLGLTFYFMITPLGIVMKLLGKNPLTLKFDPEASSYWIHVDPEGSVNRPDKPF